MGVITAWSNIVSRVIPVHNWDFVYAERLGIQFSPNLKVSPLYSLIHEQPDCLC